MAYRPSWQGHLRLSLVTCPVALYPATDRKSEVHFHLINPRTNNRIRMVATDPETGPVDRQDLVRGYEVAKDEYVLLSDDDLESVKLESRKTIDIERFAPADEIDRIYWDEPYYLAPDGKIAEETFEVIREAMARSRQIALGRVVLASRERLLGIEPRDGGMLATTLRAASEVRQPDEIFADVGGEKPDAQMIEMAGKIIDQLAGPFDPSKFVDRYEKALKALVDEKARGHRPVAAREPEDTNVVDLMTALRRSLDARRPPAASHARAPRKQSVRRRKAD